MSCKLVLFYISEKRSHTFRSHVKVLRPCILFTHFAQGWTNRPGITIVLLKQQEMRTAPTECIHVWFWPLTAVDPGLNGRSTTERHGCWASSQFAGVTWPPSVSGVQCVCKREVEDHTTRTFDHVKPNIVCWQKHTTCFRSFSVTVKPLFCFPMVREWNFLKWNPAMCQQANVKNLSKTPARADETHKHKAHRNVLSNLFNFNNEVPILPLGAWFLLESVASVDCTRCVSLWVRVWVAHSPPGLFPRVPGDGRGSSPSTCNATFSAPGLLWESGVLISERKKTDIKFLTWRSFGRCPRGHWTGFWVLSAGAASRTCSRGRWRRWTQRRREWWWWTTHVTNARTACIRAICKMFTLNSVHTEVWGMNVSRLEIRTSVDIIPNSFSLFDTAHSHWTHILALGLLLVRWNVNEWPKLCHNVQWKFCPEYYTQRRCTGLYGLCYTQERNSSTVAFLHECFCFLRSVGIYHQTAKATEARGQVDTLTDWWYLWRTSACPCLLLERCQKSFSTGNCIHIDKGFSLWLFFGLRSVVTNQLNNLGVSALRVAFGEVEGTCTQNITNDNLHPVLRTLCCFHCIFFAARHRVLSFLWLGNCFLSDKIHSEKNGKKKSWRIRQNHGQGFVKTFFLRCSRRYSLMWFSLHNELVPGSL